MSSLPSVLYFRAFLTLLPFPVLHTSRCSSHPSLKNPHALVRADSPYEPGKQADATSTSDCLEIETWGHWGAVPLSGKLFEDIDRASGFHSPVILSQSKLYKLRRDLLIENNCFFHTWMKKKILPLENSTLRIFRCYIPLQLNFELPQQWSSTTDSIFKL